MLNDVSDAEFQTQRLSNARGLHNIDDKEPEDKGNAIWLIFLLYGIGVLLPFNVIMSCLDYYADVVSIVCASADTSNVFNFSI